MPPNLQGLHVQISISIFSPCPPIYKDCMFRSLSLSSPQAPQATRIACSDLYLYLLPRPPNLQGLHVQISISIFSPGPPSYKDCMFRSLSLSSPQAPQSTRIACSNLYLYLLHSPPSPPPPPPKLQGLRVLISVCIFSTGPPSYEECMFGEVSIRDKDDSENTAGNLTFAPRYSFYRHSRTAQSSKGS